MRWKKFRDERDDAFPGMAFVRMIDKGSDSDGIQRRKG
jgi:hypothetical protein